MGQYQIGTRYHHRATSGECRDNGVECIVGGHQGRCEYPGGCNMRSGCVVSTYFDWGVYNHFCGALNEGATGRFGGGWAVWELSCGAGQRVCLAGVVLQTCRPRSTKLRQSVKVCQGWSVGVRVEGSAMTISFFIECSKRPRITAA